MELHSSAFDRAVDFRERTVNRPALDLHLIPQSHKYRGAWGWNKSNSDVAPGAISEYYR